MKFSKKAEEDYLRKLEYLDKVHSVVKYSLDKEYEIDIKNSILKLTKSFIHNNLSWIEEGTFFGKDAKIKIFFKDTEIISYKFINNSSNYCKQMKKYEEKFIKEFDDYEI